MTELQKTLFSLSDEKYKEFFSPLVPNIDKRRIIGVRTPQLKALAKDFYQKPEGREFMASLPHEYYEENNIHGFMIERIKDFDECLRETEKYLPYIDNWSSCDQLRPAVFKKHRPELLEKIKVWICSDEVYTVRFAIGMLMVHFLDEDFSTEYPELVGKIRTEEYYVNMMSAWYFATALAKQYDSVLPYFTERRLQPFVHNKAIQKAVESRRVSDERKAFLRTLKY